MGMWDLIEAKQRRKARHPILVGDLEAAAAEIAPIRARLDASKDPAEQESLRADIKAVFERQTAWIDLQSLSMDEWDELVGELEPDDEGGIDLLPVLAPVLAASCVDPEGRDVERWSQQLKRPEWSVGDKRALAQKLLELNVYAPTGGPGKG